MSGIGLPEFIVILLIILLIFGAKKLPDIARSMGKAIREFQKATREGSKDPKKDDNEKGPDTGS